MARSEEDILGAVLALKRVLAKYDVNRVGAHRQVAMVIAEALATQLDTETRSLIGGWNAPDLTALLVAWEAHG